MQIPYVRFIIISLWVMAFFTVLFALVQAWSLGHTLALLVGLSAPIMAGVSTGILIFASRQTEHFPSLPQANPALNNRLADLMSVMDDDERHAFKQALKDRYLHQDKPKRLFDGELPFDDDVYEYDRQ
jgi:hypothetical protein